MADFPTDFGWSGRPDPPPVLVPVEPAIDMHPDDVSLVPSRQVQLLVAAGVATVTAYQCYRWYTRPTTPAPPQPPVGRQLPHATPVEAPRQTRIAHGYEFYFPPIGEGGFGTVYKGMELSTGRLVAIKEARHIGAQDFDELKNEYGHVKSIVHPNIVRIIDFKQDETSAYLFLEWCANGSLSTMIHGAGATEMREARIREYTRQILTGLQALHERPKPLLHRDIKPGNILVDSTGTLKLTDFGLSRHETSMRHTQNSAGTRRYMSPEVLEGHYSVGTDIWAVGCTVVEMATRALPWSHLDLGLQRQGPLEYHIVHNQGKPQHHPRIPQDLSDAFKSFLAQCFHPNAAARGPCTALLALPWFSMVLPSQ